MAGSTRRRGCVVSMLLSAVLLVGGGWGVARHYDLDERDLPGSLPWDTTSPAEPSVAPEQVPPPSGLQLPEAAPPRPVAEPLASSRPLRRLVRRAVEPWLRDRDLGRSFGLLVTDLDGNPVFRYGDDEVTPASTTKLLTGLAALEVLGPEHTFETTVVQGRGNQVILVGGGDPYLASKPAPGGWPARADVRTLARSVAPVLRAEGLRKVRVGFDDSLFSGPPAAATWEPDYLGDDVVAPIGALWVDGGRDPSGWGRVDDPPARAGAVFAAALERQGVRVVGGAVRRTTPASAPVLASISSAPLSQIVERVIEVSDNESAEVLAHHVGLAVEGRATFGTGVRAVESTLADLGIAMTEGEELHDGSGLSRRDLLSLTTIARVLAVAADPTRPELRPVITGLPVAGFNGSLQYRFQEAPAAGLGRVRAKTGTLSGVSGLAGIATDLDDQPLIFVMVADRVRPQRPGAGDVRVVLDDLAAALATCHCSS